MKKLSIAILVLLVAGVTFIPKQLGVRIEDRLREELVEYNKLTAEHYEIIEYQRGWFGSTAVLQARGYDGQTQYTLVFDVAIDHGPRSLTWELGSSVSTLRSLQVGNSDYSEQLRALFGDTEPLVIESHYLSSGETELQLTVAPINDIESPGSSGAMINWGGATGHGVNGPHFDMMSIDVHFEPLEVVGPKAEMRIEQSRLYGEFERRGDYIYVGKEALEVSKVTISGTMMPVEMDNLIARIAIEEEGGLVDIRMDVGLGAVSAGGMPLPSWDASLAVNHIGIASLDELAGKFIEFSQHPQGPEEVRELLMGESGLRGSLEQILAGEPELVLELSRFESMLGNMEGKLVASYQGGVDDLFNNPEQLPVNLKASFELVMDASLLDVALSGAVTQLEQFMARGGYGPQDGSPQPGKAVPGPEELKALLVAAGALVEEGARYRTQVAWGREGATINGKPVGQIEAILRSRIQQ